MFRLGKDIVRWFRRHGREQDRLGQAVIVVAVTLISLRFIFPVWHLWDGYVLYLYPFRESATCLERRADCTVDRSRTAMESGAIALAAGGVLYVRHKRRK